MTAISVVIPTRGRPTLVVRSVRAVLDNDHKDFDVTVIDQSDDAATATAVGRLASSDTRLRYVHTPVPGLSRAYNIGARLTSAPLIAFTDDDCVAARDWLSAIARAFEREPAAEMLYGRVALPEELRAADGEVPVLPISREERLQKRHGFRIYGMGANFAVRRRLLERIGGFDEILGGGAPLRSSQDFDLQYRAYLSGAAILLRPEVSVDHYGLRSKTEWPATLRAYGIGDGAFYMKHVRCGDTRAAAMLVKRLARTCARQVRHLADRRRPSHSEYLRAFVKGVWASLAYRIDRDTRLYLPRSPV